MMIIHWRGKRRHHDTHNVQHLWFPTPTTVHYTIAGQGHYIATAKTKAIERIITDEISAEFSDRQ